MNLSTLLLAAAVTLSAGLASADALDHTTTTICLDSGGHRAAATCTMRDASRLNQQADVCICPGATLQVTAPLCLAGVKPPGESAAYEQARLKAVSHGSLAGAQWHSQPMCVAPHAG
ncbi:hypothetical protein [Phenylobacterium sp.]|uniref:hypothetical protein n=1 Tax=Phenylobacterium sp. TaxID=1871053 RepID=UPI00374DBFD4